MVHLGSSSKSPSGTTSGSSVAPFRIPVASRVFVTEFFKGPASSSPYAPTLLALGCRSSVVLVQLRIAEGEDTSTKDKIQYQIITEIDHPGRVHCLSWSPRTSVVGFMCLATGTPDGKINIITLRNGGLADADDSADSVTMGDGAQHEPELRVLDDEHRDYVNCVTFQPETGEMLVSGSDDHRVVVWDLIGMKHAHTFFCSSPVMDVHWHPTEASKLLAAEKNGLLHIFNVVTFTPILSMGAEGSGPLLSADWSLRNPLLVSAAMRSDLVVWDLSRPSDPVARRAVHEEGVRYVRMVAAESHGGNSDMIVATTGQPGYGVKVMNVKSGQIYYSSSGDPIGGMSWHRRLDYLAIGHDDCVTLHRIQPKN